MRKIVWKDNARCAVSFTFDVDGETLWISKDPANKKRTGVLSQGAYGPKVGVPLSLDMLERYDIQATFFVPGWGEEFHGIYHYGGFFNLTMHPQFIGRPGRLLMLEKMIQQILSYPEVWIAPLESVAA